MCFNKMIDNETLSYIQACQAMIRDNDNKITKIQIELDEIKSRLKKLENEKTKDKQRS